MLMDRLPPDFAPSGRYHRRLLRVLDRAYTAHGANHDSEIGCDGYTFGTGVWRGAWFFAGKEFEGIRGADPLHPGNAFFIRFTSPDCRLFLYRDRGKGDIDKRYPFSGASGVKDRIAENNIAYQATFSFMADVLEKQRRLVSSGDRGSIPDLVLLHRGTPAEGLTRAAIGLPLSRGEADSAWIFNTTIYQKSVSPRGGGIAAAEDGESRAGSDVPPFDQRDVAEYEISPEEDKGDGETRQGGDDRRSS
jgi:hypothetical protein